MKAAATIPVLSLLAAGVAYAQPGEALVGDGIGRLIDQGVLGIVVIVLGFAVWRLFLLLQTKDAQALATALKVTEVLPAFTTAQTGVKDELKAMRDAIERRNSGGFGGPGTGGGE